MKGFFVFAELAKVGVRVEELLESLSKLLEEDKKREKELQVCNKSILYTHKQNYLIWVGNRPIRLTQHAFSCDAVYGFPRIKTKIK